MSRSYDEVVRENDRLRYILAKSNEPCLYCGLAASDMAKCAGGFPGCGRMDDMLVGWDVTKTDEIPKDK